MTFKIYRGTKKVKGQAYSQRFLLTEQEYYYQLKAGALPKDTCEVIGMQDCADIIQANFELQAIRHVGEILQ